MVLGCLPLTKNSRKFRHRCGWSICSTGNFPGRIDGNSEKVVLFSRLGRIRVPLLSISDVRGQGLFSAHFTDRWFHSAVQKFWSRENIFCCSAVSKILITWRQTVCFPCTAYSISFAIFFCKPQSYKMLSRDQNFLTADWNQRSVKWAEKKPLSTDVWDG